MSALASSLASFSVSASIETVKFTGYANITIEAETEEQALALYNRGHYSDYDYDMDDLFYDHTFVSIREEETEPVNYYQGA